MVQVFNTEAIQVINLFESFTGVSVKDCIIQEKTIYILVEEGKINLAIGKNGTLVKELERILNKNIKIFEYRNELKDFVKSLIPQAKSIEIKDKVVEVKVDKSDRPIVIGRESKNLKIVEELLKRNSKIEKVVVK
jgi:N utilization substance protein A